MTDPLARQDCVAVVPRATSEDHLRSNLAVLDVPPLEPKDTAAIDGMPKDQRVINPSFAPDRDVPL